MAYVVDTRHLITRVLLKLIAINGLINSRESRSLIPKKTKNPHKFL